MPKHFDKQFKLDAVQHYQDHKELGLVGYATKLVIVNRLFPDGKKTA